METEIHLRRLDTPLAKALAETILIHHDLVKSAAMLKLVRDKYPSSGQMSEEAALVGVALFRDAIVQFVECFAERTEHPLSVQDVYGSIKGAPEFFNEVKDFRDSYAAHKFGAQRQCVVGVAYSDEHGPFIGHLAAVYQGPHDIAQLVGFAEVAVAYAERRIKDMTERLASSVKTMTRQQVEALPPARVTGLGPGESRLSRNALQKVRDGVPVQTRSNPSGKPPSRPARK